MADARQSLQAARADLILDHPFFGSLALRLKIVEKVGLGTMATDGQALYYDPKFVEKCSKPELLGVVAHEVMHCACGHPWRRGSREQWRFNVAADFAINYVIEEARLKLPAGRLRDAAFDGKSMEWIYDRLPPTKFVKVSGVGGGSGDADGQPQNGKAPGAGGLDVLDAPDHGAGAEDGASEADWQQAVQQAAQAAQQRGDLPASLKRFAKQATEPRVDWRSVLRRFVQSAAKSDYSWTRPSTRHLARGLYLPSLRSEAMGPIAIAIDTSGSIDEVVLGQFAAEIQSIADEMRPERIHAIYCDAAVNKVGTFEPDDPIILKPCGGGGTDFRPAFRAVDDLDDSPACFVYLTDMYGRFPDEAPGYPVLWAATTKTEAPFGEVVSMER